MSGVSSINASQSLQELYQLLDLQSVGTTTQQDTLSSVSSTGTSGVSFQKSKPGEVLNKLAQLLESDPDKFKEVTAKIAEKLKEAAASATGQDAERLNSLAEKFQQASDSGDLSALQPPPPPPQGNPYAGQSTGSNDSSMLDMLKNLPSLQNGTGANSSMDTIWDSILSQINQALNTTT